MCYYKPEVVQVQRTKEYITLISSKENHSYYSDSESEFSCLGYSLILQKMFYQKDFEIEVKM